MKTILKLTFLLLLSGFLEAQSFKFKREVKGVEKQWHKISLPLDVLEHTQPNFSDLRILSKTDSIEAPYIIEKSQARNSTELIPLKRINKSYNSEGYFYTLLAKDNLDLNTILLDFDRENFDWRVKIEGSQEQKKWFTIKDNYRIVSVKNSYTDYQFTKLVFPPSRYKYYRICIKTKTNPKLTEASFVKQSSESVKLVPFPVSSTKSSVNKEDKKSVIEIQLGRKLPVSQVNLRFRETIDFYRQFRLEYLVDSVKTQKGYYHNYRTLYSGTLTSFEPTDLVFNDKKTDRIRIIIENKDNEPLHFLSAEVYGKTYNVIARFNPEKQYALFYGSADLRKPNYEIAYLSKSIPEDLSVLTLDHEEVLNNLSADAKETPLLENQLWLWGIMGIIVILLVLFSLKMIKSPKN